MNPSIAFNTGGSDYLIVRVKPASLAAHIADAPAFNNLIRTFVESLGNDVMNGGYQALPLGPELAGRWLASSPMGQEYTTPAAAWMFDERIKLALANETHPLMVIQATGKTENELTTLVEQVLGKSSVAKTMKHRERTALDDTLDNMWGDEGGTC